MMVGFFEKMFDPSDCTHMVKEVLPNYDVRCKWCSTILRFGTEIEKRVHIVETKSA